MKKLILSVTFVSLLCISVAWSYGTNRINALDDSSLGLFDDDSNGLKIDFGGSELSYYFDDWDEEGNETYIHIDDNEETIILNGNVELPSNMILENVDGNLFSPYFKK